MIRLKLKNTTYPSNILKSAFSYQAQHILRNVLVQLILLLGSIINNSVLVHITRFLPLIQLSDKVPAFRLLLRHTIEGLQRAHQIESRSVVKLYSWSLFS